MKKNEQDLAYYMTMFKIEGHETWRINVGGTPESFRKSILTAFPGGGKIPKITAKKIYRVDRMTGEIEEL